MALLWYLQCAMSSDQMITKNIIKLWIRIHKSLNEIKCIYDAVS